MIFSPTEIQETVSMFMKQKLDIRCVTMGINLLDCADSDAKKSCAKIYDKIMKKAGNLVKVGQDIEKEFGVPIINKRISVTPIALVAGASDAKSYVEYCKTLDKCAKELGVNFIGGFSALVQKGITPADRILIDSIPEALAQTDFVCSSVNVGTTKNGINMDAVKLMGETIVKTAEISKTLPINGCAKLVVFCNAPEDNPFMAGAFHGPGEGDCVINVGVSGPGVILAAAREYKGKPINELADGSSVYEDGTPVKFDSRGMPILRYYDSEGSLYCMYKVSGHSVDYNMLGKTIYVRLVNLGEMYKCEMLKSTGKEWTFTLEMPKESSSVHKEIGKPIPDSPYTLDSIDISPISIRMNFSSKDGSSNASIPMFSGVKLKDGTLLGIGDDLHQSKDGKKAYSNCFFVRAIDPEKVKSIMICPDFDNNSGKTVDIEI